MTRARSAWFARPLVAGLAAAAVLALALERSRPWDQPISMGVLVPAYFYPGGAGLKHWENLAAAAQRIELEVILNPASGSGRQADPNYVAVARRLKTSGTRILGYVPTTYGERDPQEIDEELQRYRDFYDVDGFFIDEMSNTTARLGYYVDLYSRIKGLDARYRVIGNPGTLPDPAYLEFATADVLVTFEGKATTHERFANPAWLRHHPPSRTAHIVYSAPTPESMHQTLRHAITHRVGWVYITDDNGTNPYDRLPTYWDQEVQALQEVNRRQSPKLVGSLSHEPHPSSPNQRDLPGNRSAPLHLRHGPNPHRLPETGISTPSPRENGGEPTRRRPPGTATQPAVSWSHSLPQPGLGQRLSSAAAGASRPTRSRP